MDTLKIAPGLFDRSTPPAAKDADPARIRDAAQQFEALLLAQLLHGAHPSGGWLGGGDEGASGTAFGFAEQQLATTMAQHGGIGLAALIRSGLEKQQGATDWTRTNTNKRSLSLCIRG
jgi:Rod binding domain-containing protein